MTVLWTISQDSSLTLSSFQLRCGFHSHEESSRGISSAQPVGENVLVGEHFLSGIVLLQFKDASDYLVR